MNKTNLLKEADELPAKEYHNPSGMIVLDTVTTGTNLRKDEILQLAITDGDGNMLFDSFIHPYSALSWPEEETHTTYGDIEDAPYPHEVLPVIKGILGAADTVVYYGGYYKIQFLEKWLLKDLLREKKQIDVCLDFARYSGELYDDGSYRFKSLAFAADKLGFGDQTEGDAQGNVKAVLFIYRKLRDLEKAYYEAPLRA